MRAELFAILPILEASKHEHVRAHARMLRDRYRSVVDTHGDGEPRLRLVKTERSSGGSP